MDPLPADATERATSSSAVSRRFVALSTKRLQAFLDRPLGELDLRVVCIDGKVFRDHCMVIALGIDTQDRKHVLGLREGATETAVVTTGKTITRIIPAAAGAETRTRIAEHRRFRHLSKALVDVSTALCEARLAAGCEPTAEAVKKGASRKRSQPKRKSTHS